MNEIIARLRTNQHPVIFHGNYKSISIDCNPIGKTSSEAVLSSESSAYLTVIIVISSIVAVLLLCFVVVMYRRKKTLGGFYICTLPPTRDYIKILDQNKFIHEQIKMLPYLSEWEFPREKIILRK